MPASPRASSVGAARASRARAAAAAASPSPSSRRAAIPPSPSARSASPGLAALARVKTAEAAEAAARALPSIPPALPLAPPQHTPIAPEHARALLLVDALIVLYALAYQLQTPLEPFLVETLVKADGGASSTTAAHYARLQSFFGLVQCLGSLLVGGLIDRLGIRAMLLVNFAACAASYALLASATTMAGLYASKVPTIFMAGYLCAQTAVSTLAPQGAERVKQLGRLTMAYTIGATVGPSLGGFLGTVAAARLAVAVSAAAAALVLQLPSGSLASPPPAKGGSSGGGAAVAPPPPRATWTAQAAAVVALAWPLLATKALAGLVNSGNGAVRTLALKNVFSLTAAQLGLVMSSISFGTAIASLGLGEFTQLVGSEFGVVKWCLAGMVGAFACQAGLFVAFAAAPTPPPSIYVGLALLLALCQFPMSTTLTAISTTRVPQDAKGTLVGLEHALFALASMAGPGVGVAVLGAGGMQAVAGAAAVVYALLLAAWSREGGVAPSAAKNKGKGKK